MKRSGRWICLITLTTALPLPLRPDAGVVTWLSPATAQAATDADTGVQEAAVYLLRQSMVPDRQGTHNELLKSIRHMQDPATRPLFDKLANAEHPGLKIHGLLGMAELSADKQVDLARIAQIDDPAVQSTVITASMDDKLLDNKQAKQLLEWDGLADEVKVLVAVRLLEAGEFDDVDMLKHAMTNSKKLGGSALAALLLVELGDTAGTTYLQQSLDTSDDEQRDAVRGMLLQTALRHQFTKAAPWALKVAQEPNVDPALELLALRTALRFNTSGAAELWRAQFTQPDRRPADRVRLALTALHLSPWLSADIFNTIEQDPDPLLHAIGVAGGHIATGSAEAGDSITQLLEIGHPMVNSWALGYAREHASETDAQVILLGLILAYEHSPPRGKARRLDEAIEAVQALYERSPGVAVKLLQPIVTEPGTDQLLAQAVLLGLVRTQSTQTVDVIDGVIDQLNSPDARGLALLLLARSDKPMDAKQLEELSLLARGGGRLEDSLRIQAAWFYLKRTGKAEQALAQVLGS
ncbi:MAG: hypothetical protein R3C45_13535 [Phycisphaerales bacterium]